eukprot:GILI01002286.1.p1 GENE.GILI01002286.1~~GILI01002286.1.p1  ORF type:complete len:146 (-),score=49.45 GILI01002286.1:483-920(-)
MSEESAPAPTSPAPSRVDKKRASITLERFFSARPQAEELVQKNILKEVDAGNFGMNMPSRFSLQQKMDCIDGLLKRRSSRQELVERNIIKGAGSNNLAAAQQQLWLKSNQKVLGRLLADRPTVESLVEKNILPAISEDGDEAEEC